MRQTTYASMIEHREIAAGQLVTRRSPRALKAAQIHDDGTFEGYGSVFDVLDTYGDIVRPGAYAASLARHKADGTRVKLLWQHDSECPIGIWDDVYEDDVGLYCKGRLLLDVPKAREAHLLMKSGAIDGLSIGFQAMAFEYVSADGSSYRDMLPGAPMESNQVRAVTEIDLWEVSVVTFHSNPASRVTHVRSLVGGAADSRPRNGSGDRSAAAGAADLGPLVAAIARRQAAIGKLFLAR